MLLSLVEQKNYELIKEFEGIAYRKENGDDFIKYIFCPFFIRENIIILNNDSFYLLLSDKEVL